GSSVSVAQTITSNSTATAINSPNIIYGAAGTITVTVTALGATVTGNVSLQIDGSAAQTATLTSGAAVFVQANLPAGDHALVASYAAQGTFPGSSITGSLHVDPAPLTITADNKQKNYGASLPALTVAYSGFVNGDTAASLMTAPVLTTTATLASHVS